MPGSVPTDSCIYRTRAPQVIWPHLDPLSTTRQAISTDLQHMARLQAIYEE